MGQATTIYVAQPDDLLEIKEPKYRDDKLSFRVGLKDPKLVARLGGCAGDGEFLD